MLGTRSPSQDAPTCSELSEAAEYRIHDEDSDLPTVTQPRAEDSATTMEISAEHTTDSSLTELTLLTSPASSGAAIHSEDDAKEEDTIDVDRRAGDQATDQPLAVGSVRQSPGQESKADIPVATDNIFDTLHESDHFDLSMVDSTYLDEPALLEVTTDTQTPVPGSEDARPGLVVLRIPKARVGVRDTNPEAQSTLSDSVSSHNIDPVTAGHSERTTSTDISEEKVSNTKIVTLRLTPMPEPRNPDEFFVAQVKAALLQQSKEKTSTYAKRQAQRILGLLKIAQPPDATEALLCSGEEASKHFQTGEFFPGPIFVDGAQPAPLETASNFLDEYYDDTMKVHIQDASIRLNRNKPHVREVTIKQLRERFAARKSPKIIPWNCLELATHVEDGLRPAFLSSEDCRLITKVKVPSSDDEVSRRKFEPGWKEIEKWALLAQAGSLTEPHQDSHGYSTYITVNQGIMGFGWLSNPTAAERKQWQKSPSTFTGGRWRYQILRPGRTVFFPNGTVHFVFRLSLGSDTLAFGGHVLRCSQIVSWVKSLLEEKGNPDITNEDLSVSAPAYLARVERFVKQARRMGQETKWGGAGAIAEFLRLKEEFMSGT